MTCRRHKLRSRRSCRRLYNRRSELAAATVGADSFGYAYDSANRLKSVSSNDVLLVTNFYDAKSRRVKKVTPEATATFFYDGWNLIEERIALTNGTTSTIHYYWGKDLSGALQGSGGVGGLLYLTIDGVPYIPCYDNNGNITRYLDANGSTVAAYAYDAFGKTVAQTGPLAHLFRHRFSTKYFDPETGLYYYGYRFYHPFLTRWLNRDPIGEDGGENLYAMCGNNAIASIDAHGESKVVIPLDPYFSDQSKKMPFQISKYVDVYLGSLQLTGKEKYHYKVVFIARFTPPPEVDSQRKKQSPFSKFLWGDANRSMGSAAGMFESSSDVGDVPSGVWRHPEVSSLGRSSGNVGRGRRYNYQRKLFQFGYFEYRLESNAEFKKTAFNTDMYSDWEIGGARRMLNDSDMSSEGDISRCDTVVVVYGDIGCKPRYLAIRP